MADEDDDDDADTPRFEWSSNGGCERCDALDGHLCDEEPPRPHPDCDCSILERSRPHNSCDSSDVRYEIQHAGNIHHDSANPAPDDEFDLVFDYTIHCWGDAEEISGEIVITRTYGDFDDVDQIEDAIDDALAEALEDVEELAVEECPVCGEHPHVS
ncbi:MAG: hypothetical protein EYC70_09505 [Planctomycetota bacterium]|nr:MAG: hypothetical protein EYC70_09505 [Planctomycetota bacterium]